MSVLAAATGLAGYSSTASVMTFVFPVVMFLSALLWLFFKRGRS